MRKQRKAPRYTFWRGPHLWGRIKIKGRVQKWTLRTDDVEVAKVRVKAERDRRLAEAHYGDDRKTWEDAVIGWGEHHIGHAVGPNTVERYAVSVRQLEPFLRGCFLDQINKAKMVEIVDGRRESGVSTATIRRDLTAMSSVLGYAEDQDWIEGNPALARLRRLKERRNPIVLPQAAHIERVLKRAPGLLSALGRAALVTGCRQDELVRGKQPDLDRARKQLTVIGKGNRVRVIDLDYEDGFEVFRSLPVSLSGKWLFWHDGGKPYRQVSSRFAAIVKSVLVEAQKEARLAGREEPDFRPFRFHDLRHVHAVRWLKSGRSIYDLQGRLGHASIKTTEIYLAFLTPEEARAVKYGGVPKGTTVTGGLSS